MQKQLLTLFLIFLFSTKIICTGNILAQAREISQTLTHCPHQILSHFLENPTLQTSVLTTPEISEFCPNLKSRCCIKQDFENLLEKFKAGQNQLSNIINAFQQVLEKFKTERTNGFEKIKNASLESKEKCKDTKLANIENLLKEVEQMEEVALSSLKSIKERNDLYYSGFPCNICNGSVGNIFSYDNEKKLGFKMNLIDVKFIFNTFERYFDVLVAFTMITDVFKINLCLDGERYYGFVFKDAILDHIKSNIDKCKPIFEADQINYESEEMVNCLKLISINGILEKNSLLGMMITGLNQINSLNKLEKNEFTFFPNLLEDDFKAKIILSSDEYSWNCISNTLNYNKWGEESNTRNNIV